MRPRTCDESDGNEEKMSRNEIIFEVTEAPEGGYDARALGHGVFTQGEDWDDLKEWSGTRCAATSLTTLSPA